MKKTSLLLIVLAFGLISNISFGQVYEKVYELAGAEVQNRMNQNKMNGIDILSDINAHQVIGVSGIGASQKANLENLLAADERVSTYTVSDDVTSVILDANASFTKEEFIALIQPLNGTVVGYTTNYSVQE